MPRHACIVLARGAKHLTVQLLRFRSADGTLYAFPASCSGSCAPMWTAVTQPSNPFAAVAVADGVVYLGSDGVMTAFSH